MALDNSSTVTGYLIGPNGKPLKGARAVFFPLSQPSVGASGVIVVGLPVRAKVDETDASFSVELVAGTYDFYADATLLFRVEVPGDGETYSVDEVKTSDLVLPPVVAGEVAAYIASLLMSTDGDLYLKDGKHLLWNEQTGTYHRVTLTGAGNAMTTLIDPIPVSLA
jgi:hypothetical protein